VAQLDELEASENARYRGATGNEAREPGTSTDGRTAPRARKIIVRHVRTGGRALRGANNEGADPRVPSTGRSSGGREPGTATPDAAGDRSSRPRTRGEAHPPSKMNRKRGGSGSSHAPRS
jgi:hypothetical protein